MKTLTITCMLLVFVATACGPTLDIGKTRCSGDVVEIYDADERWSVKVDCSQLEPIEGQTWTCCELTGVDTSDGGMHVCQPVTMCGSAN